MDEKMNTFKAGNLAWYLLYSFQVRKQWKQNE